MELVPLPPNMRRISKETLDEVESVLEELFLASDVSQVAVIRDVPDNLYHISWPLAIPQGEPEIPIAA